MHPALRQPHSQANARPRLEKTEVIGPTQPVDLFAVLWQFLRDFWHCVEQVINKPIISHLKQFDAMYVSLHGWHEHRQQRVRAKKRNHSGRVDKRFHVYGDGSSPATCHLENWSLSIFVDSHDRLTVLHAGEVLDGPGDPDSHVQVWRHDLACLPDLILVRDEPGVHCGPRSPNCEVVCERSGEGGQAWANAPTSIV